MTIKSTLSVILKLVSLIIAVPLILLVFFIVFTGPIPSCTEDSDAVKYARSLSSERLSLLYEDMYKFYANKTSPIGGYYVSSEEMEIPIEFEDLKVARIRPADANIMIEGCFDHSVYLHFEGYRFKDTLELKQIILSWGEHSNAGKEVLWAEHMPNKPLRGK